MAVADPEAWVRNVERLYQAHDAVGVTALYTPEARTKFGSRVLTPQEVHDHPAEWFASLDDYVLTRTFRAAYGDVIVSETTASYTIRAEGRKCREFVDPTVVLTDMVTSQEHMDNLAGHPGATEDEVRKLYLERNVLPTPWIEPRDVANAALFLASDEAASSPAWVCRLMQVRC
jgi:hypothetical protein